MNREILFRGQHRRKGEKVKLDGTPVESKWVYGGICQFNEDRSIIYQTKPEFQKYSVYTDTVGQYTGLNDRNGRKIFEGDILKAMGVDGEQIAPVVFRKGFFVLDEKNAFIKLGVGAFRKRQLEIIGNIHDNPELVRKDEENGEV